MNTCIKATLLLLLSFTLTKQVSAQTNYYVSTTGNDNNTGTTIPQAWLTIQKAANELQAGDTVFIKSGTYPEIVIPANSGTASNFITYTNYPGDTPILDGTSFASTYLQFYDRGIFDIKDKYYINVNGLTVKNSAGGGIMCRFGSSNITISNNTVKNCKATGIGVGYNRDNYPLATNIIAHNNFIDSCSLQSRESLSFRSVTNFEISNNTVQNTPKEGIDAKSGCSNGHIYKNTVRNAGAVGIYVDAGYPDPLYTSSHSIYVYENTVINSIGSFAVASEEGCLGENIWFYNNIAYDTSPLSGNGFCVANYGMSGPLKNIYILNNTFYGKGHRGIYINNLNVSNIFIRNNITSQNGISQIDVKSTQIDSVFVAYNLINGTNVDDGNYPVFGNPNFVNELMGDFHIAANSPAIDKGIGTDAPLVDFDGVSRPSGSGFDIGAFEYEFASQNTSIQTDFKKSILYYPNPTTGLFVVEGEQIQTLEIYNQLGQLVFQTENKTDKAVIDISNQPKGIYILKIKTKEATLARKLIIE